MTVTIELERVIRIIEKTSDREALREIYEWLQSEGLLKHLPDELYWKLVDSLEPEEMTKEDVEALKEVDAKEGFLTLDEAERRLEL